MGLDAPRADARRHGLALALGIAVGLEPWRLVLLTLAVFCGQLSIGLSNDAIDAPRDRAVGRTDKPIARGEVSERLAWACGDRHARGGARALGTARMRDAGSPRRLPRLGVGVQRGR